MTGKTPYEAASSGGISAESKLKHACEALLEADRHGALDLSEKFGEITLEEVMGTVLHARVEIEELQQERDALLAELSERRQWWASHWNPRRRSHRGDVVQMSGVNDASAIVTAFVAVAFSARR